MPHHRLLRKLKYYNLDNSVVRWVSSFLTGRTQRVVVDGNTSSEAAVLSGVPQGTVLGTLLFLVFINDIIQGSSSSIRLFADVCLVNREIRSKSDCSALQSDLDNLVHWSKTWGMEFNISKCNILSVTNATMNKIKHQYTMDGQALKTKDSTEYSAVTINSKLHWKQRINNISGTVNNWSASSGEPCTEARKTSSPRPTQLWCAPRLSTAAQSGTLTTRSISTNWTWYNGEPPDLWRTNPYRLSENPTSVTALVEELGWDSLQNRRLHSRLTMFYRVIQGLVEIPPQYHPKPHPQLKSTKRHLKQFQRHRPVNAYAYAFPPRTIKDWNALPWDVMAAESLDTFKQPLHPRRQWT